LAGDSIPVKHFFGSLRRSGVKSLHSTHPQITDLPSVDLRFIAISAILALTDVDKLICRITIPNDV